MTTDTPSPSIALRDTVEEDIEIFYAYHLDDGARRMVGFTWPNGTRREVFVARWRAIVLDPAIIERTIVVDGAVAGHVVAFERHGIPEVGYWLGRSYWGRGIATAALRMFLEVIPPRRWHARVADGNAASLRVLTKCGFTPIDRERSFSNERDEEIDEHILVLETGARE